MITSKIDKNKIYHRTNKTSFVVLDICKRKEEPGGATFKIEGEETV